MNRRILMAALAVPCIAQLAHAADTVVLDNFNNSIVTDTDTTAGFWTPHNSGSLSAAAESGGSLRLTAGGSQFPHGQISSAVSSDFNFFRAPLVISASGLNFTSPTNSLNKSILRLAMSSRGLFDAAPTPPAPAAGIDDSEYWADDVVALRIESGATVAGQYNVVLGVKENYPVHNSEYDGFQLFNPGNNPGAQRPGPIRSFTLTYSPKFWDLTLIHDTSPTNSTPVTAHFTGGVDQFMVNWHDPSDAGPTTGNSAIFLQNQLNNAGAAENSTMAMDQFSVGQLRQGWQGASGANWSDPASWSDSNILHINGDGSTSSVPNFVGANVKFANAAAPTVVTVDLDQTLGAMLFNSAQSFTVQPGGLGQGTLQMDTRWLANEITVQQGSHTVISPINIYKNLNLSATAANASVDLKGQITDMSGAGTLELSKAGPGKANLLNVRFYTVNITDGTLGILPGALNNDPAGASSITNLALSGTIAAPTAKMDITNNVLVVATSTDNIRQLLRAGLSTGNGIVSSTSTASLRVAYANGDFLVPGGGTYAGQFVDGSRTILLTAVAGDANLSGSVNLGDFTLLAANFGSSSAQWINGDFNYDGSVNLSDFTLLAANFGLSATDLPRGSAVPEPAAATMLLVPAVAMLRRRRMK